MKQNKTIKILALVFLSGSLANSAFKDEDGNPLVSSSTTRAIPVQVTIQLKENIAPTQEFFDKYDIINPESLGVDEFFSGKIVHCNPAQVIESMNRDPLVQTAYQDREEEIRKY